MSLPTLYEYYTAGGVTAGLSTDQPFFMLNNKNITLYSGALHYFRVPQEYWRDRLRKMRAAGLNAVETYVPWNLHEPEPGVFDFGQGGSDYQELLDIERFLQIAQEEDLLAIVRPGPYICAEWDLGGMPSWLLRDKGIKVRTSDEVFITHVQRFFTALLSILTTLQFTIGGPVIAFQIENEYGNTKNGDDPVDTEYLRILKRMFEDSGIVEMLFTSDTPSNGNSGSLPDVLYTANFDKNPEIQLDILRQYQPDKPLMVMEYWTGWFDHWTEQHHTRPESDFSDILERIITYPSSVNMYMFHGGSNWGFLNGGNLGDSTTTDNHNLLPTTNSYDYDAPLTEEGDYTEKYDSVARLVEQYNEVKTQLPDRPALIPRIDYATIDITEELTLEELLAQSTIIPSETFMAMEDLPINNDAGQTSGYIVYRKQMDIPPNSILKIVGQVCDTVIFTINNLLMNKVVETPADLDGFGFWRQTNSTISTGSVDYIGATATLMVEHFARNNFGNLNQFNQFKGLWQGDVSINDVPISNIEIIPLEFKKAWTSSLTGWHAPTFSNGPVLYRAVLTVSDRRDTYIDMRNWKKGIVIVNGFVLSRYFRLGPQQAIYLPAPYLKDGENEILIFEHFVPARTVEFTTDQIFETV